MKKCILLIFIALVLSSFAVPSDIWEVLEEIKFKIYFDKKLEEMVFEPIPTAEIKSLNGEIIEIKGFLVTDEKGNQGLWEFLPFNYPYKCMSGIEMESMIKIVSKHKIVTNPEKPCTLKGRFELNTTNLLELPYILNEAECLDCE